MSTLDLNNFGVQELNAKEILELEGGVFFIPLAAIYAIWGVQAVLVGAGIGALAAVKASE